MSEDEVLTFAATLDEEERRLLMSLEQPRLLSPSEEAVLRRFTERPPVLLGIGRPSVDGGPRPLGRCFLHKDGHAVRLAILEDRP
jgi:hypothetical protein